MPDKLPQYSDIEILFSSIQNNIDPTDIDLSAADDIIVSIKKGGKGVADLVLKYSDTPDIFTIDNDAKSIKVGITSAQIGTVTGSFSVNLWLVFGTSRTTHITQTFTLDSVVKYATT